MSVRKAAVYGIVGRAGGKRGGKGFESACDSKWLPFEHGIFDDAILVQGVGGPWLYRHRIQTVTAGRRAGMAVRREKGRNDHLGVMGGKRGCDGRCVIKPLFERRGGVLAL